MAGVETRVLGPESREEVLPFLARDPLANLFLQDLLLRLGARPEPGEARSEMVGAWQHGELVAVLALRPTIALTPAGPEVLECFLPYLEPLGVGLLKSSVDAADGLWSALARTRRPRVLLDRLETAYALREPEARLVAPRPHETVRAATLDDLEPLVVAARESLREEGRPDPVDADIRGFRRWVRGRIPRARVVEAGGRIVCVGYADVRLPTGWLLQGVYCWPEARRRSFGRTTVSDLCRTAFAAGADHVQLSVVEGNQPARRLYEGLGFEPYDQLRTIIFA
jgi:ribosomal protein S18 acetylase RimI-like enzyme